MDPKEIEGSPERAADRGRAEDLGFAVTDKPSLGDPNVARALMSEFAAGVVAVRGAWLKGKQSDPQAAIRELAREYGAIVLGHDSRYHALPWHDAMRLGRRIGLVVPPIEGVSSPGETLFLTVGTSLAEIAAAHEAGRLSDGAAEAATRTMLDDTAQLIVGTR